MDLRYVLTADMGNVNIIILIDTVRKGMKNSCETCRKHVKFDNNVVVYVKDLGNFLIP